MTKKKIENKSPLILTTVQTLAMLVFAYFTWTGLKFKKKIFLNASCACALLSKLRAFLTWQRFAFCLAILSRYEIIFVSLATTIIKYFAAFRLLVVIVARESGVKARAGVRRKLTDWSFRLCNGAYSVLFWWLTTFLPQCFFFKTQLFFCKNWSYSFFHYILIFIMLYTKIK